MLYVSFEISQLKFVIITVIQYLFSAFKGEIYIYYESCDTQQWHGTTSISNQPCIIF